MCLVCYSNRGRIIGISSMSLKCAANITMRHARHVALKARVGGVLKVAETTPQRQKEKERRYVVGRYSFYPGRCAFLLFFSASISPVRLTIWSDKAANVSTLILSFLVLSLYASYESTILHLLQNLASALFCSLQLGQFFDFEMPASLSPCFRMPF